MKSRNHALVLLLTLSSLCALGQQSISPTSTSASSTEKPLSQAAGVTPAEKAPVQAQDQASDVSTAMAPAPVLDPKTGKPYYESIRENWKSLSVKGSDLTPEPPLVGEVDEEAKFTRTLVALKWRPGDALDVYVIMPKGVTKPPAVLYLYNYTEEADRFRDNDWCERVTAQGMGAVGFVAAMSGHRFHDRPLKQWFVSELQESLGSTVHDVKFILDYLDSRGDIDMNRIGMFGQGSGGTIAILAAAADPRIKVVDVLEPWGDWPVWLAESSVVQEDPEKDSYTKKDFLEKVKPLDPVKWLPKMKSTKIRIQQIADYDDSVPEKCQDRIKTAAPKHAEVNRFDNTMQLATVEGGGRMWIWMRAEMTKLPPPDDPNKNVSSKGAVAKKGDAGRNTTTARD